MGFFRKLKQLRKTKSNKKSDKKSDEKSDEKKGKKVVFDKVSVQEFYFSKEDFPLMYYTRPELQVLNQSRFDEAAKLRQYNSKAVSKGKRSASDDINMNSKSGTPEDLATTLTKAYTDPDNRADVTIRGIEHFVYSLLQQEMVKRKRELQREVVQLSQSKSKDPQGLRVAQTSMNASQWARDVCEHIDVRTELSSLVPNNNTLVPVSSHPVWLTEMRSLPTLRCDTRTPLWGFPICLPTSAT